MNTRPAGAVAQPRPRSTDRHDHGGLMNTTGGIETVLAEHVRMKSTAGWNGSPDPGSPKNIVRACICEQRISDWPWVLNDPAEDGRRHRAHVAAAIRAHLMSDAVVERAARAVVDIRFAGSPLVENDRTVLRAALAAAVGGDTDDH